MCRFLGARAYEIRGGIVVTQVKIVKVYRRWAAPTDDYGD
jgi:hypothetical protein